MPPLVVFETAAGVALGEVAADAAVKGDEDDPTFDDVDESAEGDDVDAGSTELLNDVVDDTVDDGVCELDGAAEAIGSMVEDGALEGAALI